MKSNEFASGRIMTSCSSRIFALLGKKSWIDMPEQHSLCIASSCIVCAAAVQMAEGNQPQKSNLAVEALRRNYTALHDALAQPGMASRLVTKLYSGAIITEATRDAVQTTGITPVQQANWLLQAVESSIKMDYRSLRQFTRLLKKQPVLSPIAKELRQCYRKFLI